MNQQTRYGLAIAERDHTFSPVFSPGSSSLKTRRSSIPPHVLLPVLVRDRLDLENADPFDVEAQREVMAVFKIVMPVVLIAQL